MNSTDAGRIITFYSFKGGTGRSMALANVGYLLSTPQFGNKRVLLIDWDLEAPGLHRYFSGIRATKRDVNGTRGLMGFFSKALRDYESGVGGQRAITESDTEIRATSPLANSNSDTVMSGLAVARSRIRDSLLSGLDSFITHIKDPKIDLLMAGAVDEEYAERVRTFDWERFHTCDPGFFPALRKHLAERYDFVLIDSRTGFTDTSGICTKQMPETLILVFAPNRQNIEGLTMLIKQVKSYRFATVDQRPLMIYPLASRLDASAFRLRKMWRHGGSDPSGNIVGYQATFEKVLQETYELAQCNLGHYFDLTQIPHDGDYAYGENIAARENTSEPLFMGYAYANLTKLILTDVAPWETDGPNAEGLKKPGGQELGGREEAASNSIYKLAQLMGYLAGNISGWLMEKRASLKKLLMWLPIVGLGLLLALNWSAYQRTKTELEQARVQLKAALNQGTVTQPTPTPLATATPTPVSADSWPGNWGVVIRGRNLAVRVDVIEAQVLDSGLPDVAEFDYKGGGEVVSRFATKSQAERQLNQIPKEFETSYVVQIRPWCIGAKYLRTSNVGKHKLPVFECPSGFSDSN